MSIVANFDINLRGNTAGIDAAADRTGNTIAELRAAVDKHGSGIGAKFGELGGKLRSAFAAMPGAGVITAVLTPAVYLGGAIGKAFSSSVTGIMSATTAVGAFGAATTIATGGLNLILAAVAAAGAAAIGAGMAWTGMGLASMGGIKDAQKAADKLGMSVEAVQGFAFKSKMDVKEFGDMWAKVQGTIGKVGAAVPGRAEKSFAGMDKQMEKTHNAAAKARHGVNLLGEAMKNAGSHGKADPLARWGIEAEKLKAAKPEEAINLLGEAYDKLGNQYEKVAFARQFAGKKEAEFRRLMEGGREGMARSLVEAKALGIIVSGSEAKQVAEAAGALKLMKQAMGGLGKTAAITIAPFVKLIANALTEAMKWVNSYREKIIDFAYGVEFAFKNFGEYVKLYMAKAGLYLTAFGNATIHIFTDVLPQLFRSFGEMLHEAIATGFAGGFGKAWDKAVRDIKASMARTSGEFESELREKIDANEKSLDERRRKFLEEKKAALNIPAPGESKAGGGSRDNAAVQIGSTEAFKIIAGDQGDKMFKVANEQLEVQRKTLEEMRKKRRKRGPELIDVGRI
jgi:hypothetical protein